MISLLLGAARRQREQPQTAASSSPSCSASVKPGTKKTPPPLRIVPQAPAGGESAMRERVFFCDGLAAWRPMPGGFFFLSFLLRRRRPADERSRARQTRTRGVPVCRPGQSFARLYARYRRAAKTGGRLCASEHRWPGRMGRARVQCINGTVPTGTIVVATGRTNRHRHSSGRKLFGAGFCGKIPEIPAKKIVK